MLRLLYPINRNAFTSSSSCAFPREWTATKRNPRGPIKLLVYWWYSSDFAYPSIGKGFLRLFVVSSSSPRTHNYLAILWPPLCSGASTADLNRHLTRQRKRRTFLGCNSRSLRPSSFALYLVPDSPWLRKRKSVSSSAPRRRGFPILSPDRGSLSSFPIFSLQPPQSSVCKLVSFLAALFFVARRIKTVPDGLEKKRVIGQARRTDLGSEKLWEPAQKNWSCHSRVSRHPETKIRLAGKTLDKWV